MLPIIHFMIMTLLIHFLWRFWENTLDFFPLKESIGNMSSHLVRKVHLHSYWIVKHVVFPMTTASGNTIHLGVYGRLKIFEGCSGLKQFVQFGLMIMSCKGKWRNKVWFIPAGVVLLHVVNIIRMTGLSSLIVYLPRYWDFGHDLFFKGLFYQVIFILWVIWTEYFSKGNSIPKKRRKDKERADKARLSGGYSNSKKVCPISVSSEKRVAT